MMKKMLVWLLMMLLAMSIPAMAEETAPPSGAPGALTEAGSSPSVERMGLALGDGSVSYPQLTGLEDAAVQEQVNALLLEKGGIEGYLNRLALTMQSATPLQVDYTAFLEGDVLSWVQLAKGPVESERITQVYAAASIDLRTGEEITWADLFLDEASARAALEDYLLTEVAPELSPHLSSSELTPLPDVFGLTSSGMMLCYPIQQLCTLSDRAGTVTILWYELRDHLNLAEGSVLERIGAADMLTLGEASRSSIGACVQAGRLPGIPVGLGGSMQEATDTFGLLLDPDLYAQGRLFQLEDGAFRGVYLLTDSLTSKWENSVIQGIRADRINLYGLCTGQTAREAWLAALGEPDATVPMDSEQASAYRMVPGISDYYRFGEYQLRLHADESGVLASLFITQ